MQPQPDNTGALRCIQNIRPERPLLSVLVRVKNEIRALPVFWKKLEIQSCFTSTEIIFLDSGSTDGTVEYLNQFPCCIYTIAPEEFSFGSSCNMLMSLSTAPVAVFLSGHVLLSKSNDLEVVRELLKSHKNGAAYMRQVPNAYFGANIYEQAFLSRRFSPALKENEIVVMDRPGAFSNAASALTREAWLSNKFPDMHGSEDFVWAQRHLWAGRELFYLPGIEVLHSHNESPEAVYQRVRLNVKARNQQRSYWKAAYCLGGIFAQMLRRGAGMEEAWSYASHHARAYL